MNEENSGCEPDSKTRLRLWIKLLGTARKTEATLRENLRKEFSSTLPRFDVLAQLYQFDGGLKMSELSDHLLVSNGSATVVVDRLVKEGLVERNPVPSDRRALLVSLTKEGRQQFLQQAQAHEAWVDNCLGDISVKDANSLMEILDTRSKTDK